MPRDLDRGERKPERRPKTGRKTLLIVLLVTGVGFLVCAATGGLVALVILAPRQPRPPLPVVTVDLASLREEWAKNPIAAVEKYRGSAVRVRGYVRRIDQSLRQTYIILTPAEADSVYGRTTVRLFLLNSDLVRQMKDHPVGSQITVEATFDEATEDMSGTVVRIVAP